MTLGLYVPGRSPLHRLPAGLKLSGLAIASLLLFGLSQPGWLVAIFVLSLGLVPLARLPWRLVGRQLRAIAWVLVGIALLHALVHQWLLGLILVLRFLTLLLWATLVTTTTSVSAMMATLEGVFAPLKHLGWRPAQLSLMVALAIRLIPLILQQIEEVQEAQRARGCDRPILALFVPVLIRVLQLTDHLAEALDARGYDGDAPEDEDP